MRCPKCGYISFDHLDTCKKCNKEIGLLTSEINGTIYNSTAPSFLKFTATPSAPPLATVPLEAVGKAEPLFLREGIDTEFVLQEEQDDALTPADSPFADSDPVMDLDDFSEVSPRAEFTLDLDAEFDSGPSQLPAMDFSDLDISDLAPPAPTAAASVSEELTAPVAATLAHLAPPSPVPAGKQRPTGLEDLNFQDLELDAPAKLVSGSAAGKRYLPSVKTGTALDKFDIDLGNLFSDNK